MCGQATLCDRLALKLSGYDMYPATLYIWRLINRSHATLLAYVSFVLYCSKLHSCAEQGDYSGARAVIAAMWAARHVPGPKAYHALIISYVRGDNAMGALVAIREASSSGMF